MPHNKKYSSSSSDKKYKHHKDTSSTSTSCTSCDGKPTDSVTESCPPKACYKPCEGLCGPEIYVKYNAAVVDIRAEFHFTTETEAGGLPTQQLITGSNLFSIYTNGNGFFIDKHVIVCPASLVLAPPDHTLAFNRWPFVTNKINPANLQSDVMTRANRIMVDVLDVNGTGKAYTYQADLLAVCGQGDIALLAIDMTWPWNKCLPCVKKCHPHFRFGCSRNYRAGMEVYAIGNATTRSLSQCYDVNFPAPYFFGTDGRTFVSGTVADTRHVDHVGFAQQELIAVNLPIFGKNTGLPLIDRYGHVIGMQTLNVCGAALAHDTVTAAAVTGGTFYNGPSADGIVAGPSQFFMTHIIKKLLCSLRKRNSDFIKTVVDPVGDYIRYVHGFLGLAWELFTGAFYMNHRGPNGFPFVPNFDPANPGQYLIPLKKEVIGIRVSGLTNDLPAARMNGAIYLPGVNAAGTAAPGSNPASPWVRSPLNLALNDVITHVERCPLGDFGKQIPISLVTFRKRAGDVISLTIRTFASNYKDVTDHSVQLVDLPLFYDYPIYKYPDFPYSAAPPGYAIFFRHPTIQDPSVAGTNPLDPSFLVPTVPTI